MRVVLFAMLLLWVAVAQAQHQDDVIAFSDGDLFAWTPQTNVTERLTTWNYNGGPILSPDGETIAYLSYASEVVEALGENNPGGAGMLAGNIWIMDIATRDFERIANQVANPGNIYRSIPAWSPDSRQLVWSEWDITQAGSAARLVIYDFSTNTQRVLTQNFDLGFQDAGLYMPSVKWGAGGISRILFTFTGAVGASDGQYILELYDPQTGVMTSFNIGTTAQTTPNPLDHVWVQHEGRSMIALIDRPFTWSLFDPATGAKTPLAQPPALRLANPGISILLRPFSVSDFEIGWRAEYLDQRVTLNYTSSGVSAGNMPIITKDGNRVLWNTTGVVSVFDTGNGQTTTLIDNAPTFFAPQPYSVVGAPLAWTTSGAFIDTSPPSLSVNCPPNQNFASDTVVILPSGDPNNVRSQPGTVGRVVGQIVVGATARILEGPVCADGIDWYRVAYEGGQGWTAAGTADAMWLSPVFEPVVTCANAVEPPNILPTQAGQQAYVLPADEPNVLRDFPYGDNSNVIGNIPVGGRFTILGDNACGTDGRRWWRVEYNGQIGWTGDGEGDVRWIAPVP